ncbi:MAG TPA: SRPBCC domain-containing protein [Myxococcota bacterium]|nr:SRPBCC domain-containing protein [Myxococcota bacterium]
MGLQIGRLAVRRSIFIHGSPERVWKEFETAVRIAQWLDRGHKLHSIEPRLGGRVDMSVEVDGKRRHYGGSILVFEPSREMSFEVVWAARWEASYSAPIPSFWTFRLTPLYDGTLVEIFHHGFELSGDDAADNLEGYEQGWDIKHLKALRELVEA